MLEIPESKTIGLQANKVLTGKAIVEVINASSPHKFAWYCGNPSDYQKLLTGQTVESAEGHGMFVDVHCSNNICITIGDGTNMRYYPPGSKYPGKHQLLLVFNDDSFVVFTVAMYGAIYAYKGEFDNKYYRGSINSISPLDKAFDEAYFIDIINSVEKDLSVKALLATEQRIPGLGNGVLQDILFNARINPRLKKSKLSDANKSELFKSIKSTLKQMVEAGGRDTEKDFYGNNGAYKTILSKNTVTQACPVCNNTIVKEAYLGGAVYYCPTCQTLQKPQAK